ncbi:leucine-rich repeat protein [Skeletonema marinoi]|uniref:Leucine-rich repeat protein n=1 Tax=Skeletonema marinoi TaxID=267567 RepID=A0AAD8XYW6_9STRA|nr:leucine-rich repeat protein [Skeletonema marinoi]
MGKLTLEEALPRLRSNDATLTTLDLGSDGIGNEGVVALAGALKENTTLTTLRLGFNGIGNEGAIALADVLKENTTLTTLRLEDNDIGKEGAIALAEALKENTTLTTLHLKNNKIGNEGAIALADVLKENTTLTTLNLGWNKIGNEGAIALADALKENTTLTRLELEDNEIGKEGAIALADALKENTTLTMLHLKNNYIGKEGAIALAEALKENTTLTMLHLKNNYTGKEGAIALAEALKENTTLTALELRSNEIGNEGAIALADALKENTTLITLNLGWNKIGKEGAIALADVLKENTTLTTLQLGSNKIGKEGAIALAEALKENTTLTTLHLRSNEIGNEGVVALAEALKENTTLTALELLNNKIGNEGAIALADVLKENTTLTTLQLGSNKIDKEGAIALADVLKENTTLTELELENIQIGDEGAQVKSNILDIISRSRVFHRHKDDIEVDGFSFYFAMNEETGMLYIKESVWEAATTTDGLVLGLVHNVIREHLDACKEDDLQSTKDELKTLLNTSRNSGGSPLLHLAAARTSAKALALCQYLVKEIGVDLEDHAVTDKAGCTARDIAMAGNFETRNWAKSVGAFLGRYRVEEEGGYSSDSCTVKFATDVTKSKSDPARNVAIKIMHNREQFDRELKQRLGGSLPNTSNGFDLYTKDDSGAMIENGKGSNRFDVDHVVPLLRYHIEDFEGERYHCLIMLKGERNLDEIIRYEGIAGKDVNKITCFAVDLAKALNHLHSDHNLIHADVKPRNVVRIRGDNKLIDFDASISIGERLTEKFSSGYLPPEVAAVRFQLKEKMEDLMRRKDVLRQKLNAVVGNEDDEDKIWEELKVLKDKIKQVESAGSNSDKEEPVAGAQVDIWSFGVLVFELLTGRPLFNCDADDNLLNEEEKRRLVNWKVITDKDLSDVLKDCPDQDLTDSAKDLLRECLSTKQFRFRTFHQVLKHAFLNREELQLRKLDEGQKNIESTVKSGFNEMNVKLDQTHKMLSEMQTVLANVSRGVSNILKGCHAPQLMYIIPEDPSVMDWIKLKALVGKKVKVIFICPVTLSIPRDGNNKPMGYSMEMPRDWVRKYGPALKISYEILRIGFAVGRLFSLPLPNLSSAGSSTNVMNVLNDNLVDYMGEGALDLEELAGVLGDRVTLDLPEADENLSKHVSKGMRKLISTSYDEVKKIATQNGDEDFLQTGLTKVVYDGHVEYVLNKSEIKNMYEKEGPSCIGLTQAELQTLGASDVVVKEDVGANVDVVVMEGYLHQKKRFSWKEKKAILHKSGFIIGKTKPKVAAIDYEYRSVRSGPEETFNIMVSDGSIYEIDDADDDLQFLQSGQAVTIPAGTVLRSKSGKVETNGAKIKASKGNKKDDVGDNGLKKKTKGLFERNLEGRNEEQQRNVDQLRRHLTSLGEKSVVAVRVQTTDAEYEFSEAYLRREVFGISGSTDEEDLFNLSSG